MLLAFQPPALGGRGVAWRRQGHAEPRIARGEVRKKQPKISSNLYASSLPFHSSAGQPGARASMNLDCGKEMERDCLLPGRGWGQGVDAGARSFVSLFSVLRSISALWRNWTRWF